MKSRLNDLLPAIQTKSKEFTRLCAQTTFNPLSAMPCASGGRSIGGRASLIRAHGARHLPASVDVSNRSDLGFFCCLGSKVAVRFLLLNSDPRDALRATQEISALSRGGLALGGQPALVEKPTYSQAIRVWWSFTWRATIYGALATTMAGFPLRFVAGLFAPSPQVSALLEMLIRIDRSGCRSPIRALLQRSRRRYVRLPCGPRRE